MQAQYPGQIKDFGVDVIDGDYLLADHINALRAEIQAIQSALGVDLSNTLSAGSLLAAGDLITASAPNTLARLPVGQHGQILKVDANATVGIRWTDAVDNSGPRVVELASDPTPTPPADQCDQFNITALSVNAFFAQPSGSPVDGQRLLLRVKDNGTARGLAWHSGYAPIGVTLPAQTTPGKVIYVGAIYNLLAARWDVLAVGVEA